MANIKRNLEELIGKTPLYEMQNYQKRIKSTRENICKARVL